MSDFQLNNSVDKEKVFMINLSDIEGRLDPKYYTQEYVVNEKRLNASEFPIQHIWEVTKIVSDGTHFTPNYTETGVKFISVKDVRKSKIDFNNTKFISEQEANQLDKRCKPQKGDVLLTKIGTFGFASVVETDERFQIFVSLALLRPNKKVSPYYLEIFLNTNLAYLQYQRVIKGAGVPDLHLEDIRKVKISIPPIEKQKEIIDYYFSLLNQCRKKEAKAKELLSSIDDYLLKELGIELPEKDNSLKNRIFTTSLSKISGGRFDPFYNDDFYLVIDNQISNCNFRTVSLKDLCYYVSGVVYSGRDERNEGLAILRANNITLDTNQLNFNDIRYIDNTIKISEKLLLKEKDILISSASGSKEHVGKVAYIEKDINYYFGGFMGVLRQLSNNYNQRYLFEYLQSKLFRLYLFKNLGGTNINNLNFNMISRLKVPLPPLEKQNEIAEHITQIREEAKKLQKEAKEELEQAKQEVEQMILGNI